MGRESRNFPSLSKLDKRHPSSKRKKTSQINWFYSPFFRRSSILNGKFKARFVKNAEVLSKEYCYEFSPLWDISKKSWPIWLYWDKIMKLTKCHWKTPLCYVMFWWVRWVTLALEGGLISCLFVMIFTCVFSATRQYFSVQALVLKVALNLKYLLNFQSQVV